MKRNKKRSTIRNSSPGMVSGLLSRLSVPATIAWSFARFDCLMLIWSVIHQQWPLLSFPYCLMMLMFCFFCFVQNQKLVCPQTYVDYSFTRPRRCCRWKTRCSPTHGGLARPQFFENARLSEGTRCTCTRRKITTSRRNLTQFYLTRLPQLPLKPQLHETSQSFRLYGTSGSSNL